MAETLDLDALERLAALEQTATPGEWTVGPPVDSEDTWATGVVTLPEAADISPLYWLLQHIGPPCGALVTNPEADIRLVTELRNAAPALLRLALAGLAAETIVTPVGYQTMTPEERAAWVEWLEERGAIPTSDRLESKEHVDAN